MNKMWIFENKCINDHWGGFRYSLVLTYGFLPGYMAWHSLSYLVIIIIIIIIIVIIIIIIIIIIIPF